jgi:hypothetical protein
MAVVHWLRHEGVSGCEDLFGEVIDVGSLRSGQVRINASRRWVKKEVNGIVLGDLATSRCGLILTRQDAAGQSGLSPGRKKIDCVRERKRRESVFL